LPQPAAVVEPDVPALEEPGRLPGAEGDVEHIPWKRLPLPGFGSIVYDDGTKTGRNPSFGAHCPCRAHGNLCRLNRTTHPGGEGKPQGRPLGLLVAWLWAHGRHDTKKQHMDLVNARPRPAEAAEQLSFAQRSRARAWLEQQPHAHDLLGKERDPWPGEGPEPNGIA
jgi:hypothetical protein